MRPFFGLFSLLSDLRNQLLTLPALGAALALGSTADLAEKSHWRKVTGILEHIDCCENPTVPEGRNISAFPSWSISSHSTEGCSMHSCCLDPCGGLLNENRSEDLNVTDNNMLGKKGFMNVVVSGCNRDAWQGREDRTKVGRVSSLTKAQFHGVPWQASRAGTGIKGCLWAQGPPDIPAVIRQHQGQDRKSSQRVRFSKVQGLAQAYLQCKVVQEKYTFLSTSVEVLLLSPSTLQYQEGSSARWKKKT